MVFFQGGVLLVLHQLWYEAYFNSGKGNEKNLSLRVSYHPKYRQCTLPPTLKTWKEMDRKKPVEGMNMAEVNVCVSLKGVNPTLQFN